MSKPLSTKSSWPLHDLLGELMLVFQGAFGACFPGSLAGTAYERPAGAPSRILSEVSLLEGIPRPPSWPWPGKSSVGVAPSGAGRAQVHVACQGVFAAWDSRPGATTRLMSVSGTARKALLRRGGCSV
jgi:hypothetical protein